MTDFDYDAWLKGLNKKYARGSERDGGIVSLEKEMITIEPLSTGSPQVDRLTGLGGFPRGRISEVFGPTHTGKTTLAYGAMAEAQRQGLRVAYFDTEQGINPDWLIQQGVDIADDRFLFSRAYVAEDVLDLAEDVVRSGHFGLVVIDSVASMIAEREQEAKSVSDNFMGGKGTVMAKGLRRIAGPLADTNTALVFINHLRDKVGMVFGETTYRPGGKQLDFACSLMLKVAKGDPVQEGKETVGFTIRVTAYKNRFRPLNKAEEAAVRVYAHGGISRAYDLLQIGLDTGVIDKKGAWFYLGEQRLGQGENNVEAAIAVDGELQEAITAAIAAHDAAAE